MSHFNAAIIPELASLPRFLVPTVFSLPQRKHDFMSLIKNLGEIYLSSSDDRILNNIALSMVSLSNGDHARVADSKGQVRKIVVELRDRVVELMSSDDSKSAMSMDPESSELVSHSSRRRSSRGKAKSGNSIASSQTTLTDEESNKSAAADTEYSIYLNLKRLKVLSKKCDLSASFEDSVNNGLAQES